MKTFLHLFSGYFNFSLGLMTKRRTLELVLNPSMVCKLNPQPHVGGGRDILRLLVSGVDSSSFTGVKTYVRTQELFAKRV